MASDPIDILWKNIGGSTRGIFIFRRIALHILGIIVVLFFTTPTAMLSTLQAVDVFGVFTFQWTESLPMGDFFKSHLPPLLIICINQILLLLIDISSIIEKHETFSFF